MYYLCGVAGCHQYSLVRPSIRKYAELPEWSNGTGLGPVSLVLA